MKIPHILLLLLSFLSVTTLGLAVEEPAVELPVFKVMPGLFDYVCTFKNYQVASVIITEVPPNTASYRLGLRKGDQMIMVDGVKVLGLSRVEFEQLVQKQLEIGQSQRFTFFKSKGFIIRFNKTFDITYTFTKKLNPTPRE